MSRKLLLAAVAAVAFAAAAHAQTQLRPDQEEVLELMMRGMEPSMKRALREQMIATVAPLTEEQTALMLPGLREGAADIVEDDSAPVLSDEDFEYNRAQYEPAIRMSWQAQHEFDVHVNERIASSCPNFRDYNVVQGAALYDLMELQPNWPRASDNVETDVAVMGGSYAPQDGRYDFDFSEIRTTYDEAAVDRAIDKACADWIREGAIFKADVQALVDAEKWDEAYEYEMGSDGKVDPITRALEEVLQREAPSANYAVFNALLNGMPAE
jgi:hypothetical protein